VDFPARFARAHGRPHFWIKYFGTGNGGPGRYPEFADLELRLAPPGVGATMTIRLDAEGMAPTLFVDDFEIGAQRGLRHVLRWSEIETLAMWDALARRRPHPGAGFLLLSTFGVVCADEREARPGDRVRAMLHAAATAPGVWGHVTDTIGSLWYQLDRYRGGTRWMRWADGHHVLVQPDPVERAEAVRTLRSSRNTEFPHVQLDRVIGAAAADRDAMVARQATPAIAALARQVLDDDDAPAAFAILRDAILERCDHPVMLRAFEDGADVELRRTVIAGLAGPRGLRPT
jgi:hypothetical protein